MPGHVPRAWFDVRSTAAGVEWRDELDTVHVGTLADLARAASVRGRWMLGYHHPAGLAATFPVFLRPSAWELGRSLAHLPGVRGVRCGEEVDSPRPPVASLPFRVAEADPKEFGDLSGRAWIPGFEWGDPRDSHIVFGGESDDALLVVTARPPAMAPPGRATIAGVTESQAWDLLFALAHDVPLHDAVPAGALTCSPSDDHAFRVSTLAASLAETIVRQQLHGREIHSELEELLARRLDFSRESGAAGPLAHGYRVLSYSGAVRPEFLGGGGDPEPRVVDLRLARREYSPLGSGPFERALLEHAFVQAGDSLREGARYDVRFQIGIESSDALVRGPRPSIDPLLPFSGPEEIELEVVLHPQDFLSCSPVVQVVTIAPEGPSGAVRFVVQAPGPGVARLRVSVYSRNALLQSFRLEAAVEPEETTVAGAERTCFRMDYSRLPDFARPDLVAERVATITVNDATVGHDVMVKYEKGTGDTRMSLDQEQEVMRKFRDALRKASQDTNGERYPVDLPLSEAEFTKDLYRLARIGSDLRGTLFGDNAGAQGFLARMAAEDGLTVSFVRLSSRSALPWGAIYDWPLPPLPPTVCRGKGCGHGPADGVFCVRGFWGIRHRVEQLTDTSQRWEGPVPAGIAGVLVDTKDAKWGPLWSKDAGGSKLLPTGAEHLPDASPITTLLADAARPSIVAILGHHAPDDADGLDITLPRIEVGPGNRALTRADLSNLCNTDPKWAPVRPIVLMMACDTATPLDPFSDFVKPFLTKGALAVIATETIVFPDLAAWTTRRLLERLLAHERLADALRGTQIELLDKRIPLGFVFTAVGNADLTLA